MYTLKPCSANNPFFKAVFSTSTDTEICILEVSLSRVMKRRNPACHGNFHHHIISFQVEKSHILTTNYADESILFAFFHRKAMVLLALPDANGTGGAPRLYRRDVLQRSCISIGPEHPLALACFGASMEIQGKAFHVLSVFEPIEPCTRQGLHPEVSP